MALPCSSLFIAALLISISWADQECTMNGVAPALEAAASQPLLRPLPCDSDKLPMPMSSIGFATPVSSLAATPASSLPSSASPEVLSSFHDEARVRLVSPLDPIGAAPAAQQNPSGLSSIALPCNTEKQVSVPANPQVPFVAPGSPSRASPPAGVNQLQTAQYVRAAAAPTRQRSQITNGFQAVPSGQAFTRSKKMTAIPVDVALYVKVPENSPLTSIPSGNYDAVYGKVAPAISSGEYKVVANKPSNYRPVVMTAPRPQVVNLKSNQWNSNTFPANNGIPISNTAPLNNMNTDFNRNVNVDSKNTANTDIKNVANTNSNVNNANSTSNNINNTSNTKNVNKNDNVNKNNNVNTKNENANTSNQQVNKLNVSADVQNNTNVNVNTQQNKKNESNIVIGNDSKVKNNKDEGVSSFENDVKNLNNVESKNQVTKNVNIADVNNNSNNNNNNNFNSETKSTSNVISKIVDIKNEINPISTGNENRNAVNHVVRNQDTRSEINSVRNNNINVNGDIRNDNSIFSNQDSKNQGNVNVNNFAKTSDSRSVSNTNTNVMFGGPNQNANPSLQNAFNNAPDANTRGGVDMPANGNGRQLGDSGPKGSSLTRNFQSNVVTDTKIQNANSWDNGMNRAPSSDSSRRLQPDDMIHSTTREIIGQKEDQPNSTNDVPSSSFTQEQTMSSSVHPAQVPDTDARVRSQIVARKAQTF